MNTLVDIKVPDIGDFDTVEVIEVLVAEGDMVSIEDSLITVESDKASMEIPSSHSGIVKELTIAIGENVSEGSIILTMEAVDDAAIDQAKAKDPIPAPEKAVAKMPVYSEQVTEKSQPVQQQNTAIKKPPITSPISQTKFIKAHASPAIRKYARELGVDLSKVTGSGRNTRIVKLDVQSYIKETLARVSSGVSTSTAALGVEAMPEIDFSQWGGY